MIGIGVPVKTENLPEDERSSLPYTWKSATPPNRSLQTPEVQTEGMAYIRGSISEVFRGALAKEDIQSETIKNRSVHEVIDERLILLFSLVEHMDIGTLEDAMNREKLEEEYKRVLTNYALNRNLAYRYGKSHAG